MEDAQRLFDWRNDPLTRAMSKTTEPVEWSGHVQWLERRLSRPEPLLFIAEVDGAAIGTFRVDDDEISYTIAPEHRGRGQATAMLRLAREKFGQLRAEIKSGNAASVRAAETAGFRVVLLT